MPCRKPTFFFAELSISPDECSPDPTVVIPRLVCFRLKKSLVKMSLLHDQVYTHPM